MCVNGAKTVGKHVGKLLVTNRTCLSLHTAGAREIWIDQSGFSRREKFWCPDVKLTSQERHWNQATLLTGDGVKYPRNGIFNFKNHTRWQKVKSMNHFVFLNFYFGAKNAWHGNSLVVLRVSQGSLRIIFELFWTKYAVPRQIKPGILKLTTSRGQRNLHTVFIFVICEEKSCYRVVSLGHQNFDCQSYCGFSHRMQGYSRQLFHQLFRVGKLVFDVWTVCERVLVTVNQSKHALCSRHLRDTSQNDGRTWRRSCNFTLNSSTKFRIVQNGWTLGLQGITTQKTSRSSWTSVLHATRVRFLLIRFRPNLYDIPALSVSSLAINMQQDRDKLQLFVSATALRRPCCKFANLACCDLTRVWRVSARVCQLFEVCQNEFASEGRFRAQLCPFVTRLNTDKLFLARNLFFSFQA